MKYKILVVDDDQDIAELVKLVLETDNFTVKTVLDPLTATEAATEYQPDVILIDLLMPQLDGWTLFKLMRKEQSLKEVPIAILTAKSEGFDAMVGLHVMKADAYITKPFGKKQLIDSVYELINKTK